MFSSDDCDFCTMQDQYIEISSVIPASATLFGLGEHTSNDGIDLRRDGVPYALWTRDQPPHLPNVGVYGAHPFYMDVREGERQLLPQLNFIHGTAAALAATRSELMMASFSCQTFWLSAL